MTDPKEVEVHITAAEDAQHIVNLLKIIAMAVATPKLSSLSAEAMNELIFLNDEAWDRLAQYTKDVAARDAAIQKAADDRVAQEAVLANRPKAQVPPARVS
jgi:hypothetical protein